MKSNEHFRDAVISVVDELKAKQIKSRDGKSVTYLLTEDLVQRNKRFHGFEREAIEFLKEESVVQELERDELVIGEPDQKNYGAYQSLKLEVQKSLDLYLEKFVLNTNDLESKKLLFRVTTGELSYINNTGKSFTATFQPETNPYLVICNVFAGLGAKVEYEDCIKGTRDRKNRSNSSAEEKVRSSLKIIRKQLRDAGLSGEEVSSIFITSYGLIVAIPYTIVP